MKTYPLTTPQQNIWNLHKYYPETSIANVSGMFRIHLEYNYEAFNQAANLLLENNEALRLQFSERNGEPQQIIAPYQPIRIAEYDFRGVSLAEADAFLATLVQEPFTVEQSTLCRFAAVNLTGGQCGIFVCFHHLICDAWSMSIVVRELINYYKQALSGDVTPNPLPSYINKVDSEQMYLNSDKYANDKVYWNETFNEKPQLCRVKDIKVTRDSKIARYSRHLDDSFYKEIKDYCTLENITPAVLFETAIITYLYRINELASPVTISIPVLNRKAASEKKAIGMYVSTTLLPIPVDEDESMINLSKKIKLKHMEVFRHQRYPISKILQGLRKEASDLISPIDVMVSYQNARVDGVEEDVEVIWYPSCHSEVPLCVHIEDLSNTGNYKLHFDYQTAVLSDSEVSMLCDRLLHIIRQMIDSSAVKVKDIQIVSPDECQKVIYDFNDTATDYPKDKCIHQLFEEQVERTPDNIAVVFEEKKYTYRQINEMANSLAHLLREKGVGRDDIVAIVAKRSYRIIIAQLAILKAGGAFMPIDPNYPADRIGFMIEDAQCKAVLTLGTPVDGIDMEDDKIYSEDTTALKNINTYEDICLVIYTSGSTGTPKGTLLNHHGLINYAFANDALYAGGNCVICFSIFTFDAFTLETILPLIRGKKIVLSNEKEQYSQAEFETLLSNNERSNIFITPAKLKNFVVNSNDSSFINNVNKLCIGGEVFPQELLEIFPDSVEVFNVYGPTECSMWTSEYPVYKQEKIIPIGKPIANTQIYILDKNLQPMPIGISGELCISGDGVGQGYLNRSELTAEKFLPSLFVEGNRLYKTGDLARWREDGNIEYIGRIDNQIKLRGIRIELGEIESEIAKFEGVKQIAVVDKKDETGRQYICAYYISNEAIDENSLRIELVKSLPRYMIPHYFTRMESFPTTTSGKTDRKAFPPPDFKLSQSNVEYIPPVTENEKLLVQILESVLEISPIGMNDDFFDIGGDSLKAIEFISKAQYEGIKIDVQNVFEYTTPAKLLKHLSTEDKQSVKFQMEDFNAIHSMLRHSRTSAGIPASKHSIGDILITGATGWLGIHVLDEFLSSESGVAYCLVRGNDISDSQKRLNSTLEYYFGNKYKNCNRITVICGDVRKKVSMDKPIDTIIHCAANVKHYGLYSDSYNVNVIGTKNMIELAKDRDALLIHISTASISGNSFNHNSESHATIFDEVNLYIGQSLENVYVRSKFEAERAVLEARLHGLDVIVIRVGNLANRTSDLLFQKNYRENATLSRLKAFTDLGRYPKQLRWFPIELSPVDETAKGIITIAQHYDRVRTIFHLYNDNPVRFGAFVKAFKKSGIKMKAVSIKRFMQTLRKTASCPKKSHIYETFVNDMDSEGSLSFHNHIMLNNNHTIQYMHEIGFDWKKIDSEYMERYVKYFRDIGYFGDEGFRCSR